MKIRVSALIPALYFMILTTGAALAGQSDTDQLSALWAKNDYKGIIDLTNRMLASDPKNARALVNRGDAKDELDDYTGALADYGAAIAINPNYEYAYSTRCGTQNEVDNYRAAIDDCTKALTLDVSDADAYRRRSLAYYFSNDYQLAKADADQAMSLKGSDPWSLLTLCRAEVGLKQYKAAFTDCGTAISLSSNYAIAYFYRGRAEIGESAFTDAATDFRKDLKLNDGDDPGAHYWLAVCALNTNSYSEAVSEVDAYLLKNAGDADGLLLRAKAELQLGNRDAAKYDSGQALHQYQVDNDTDGMTNAQSVLDSIK